MKKFISICSFVILFSFIVYYVDFGICMALYQNVSTDCRGLSEMVLEDLSDFLVLCLGARVLLLLVRQEKFSSGYMWFSLIAVIWAIAVQLVAPCVTPFVELMINKGTPKMWLLILHGFVISPYLFAFLFAMKDVVGRLCRLLAHSS